jgi:hypothetical protein
MVSMVRNDSIYVLKTVTDLDLDEDQPGQPLIQDAISTQAHQDLEMQSISAGYVIPPDRFFAGPCTMVLQLYLGLSMH